MPDLASINSIFLSFLFTNAKLPMKKEFDPNNLALGFLRTGYEDYLTARFLLNNGYTLHGVILASTAIEKYFKAAIVGLGGDRQKVHLDKLDGIKNAIEQLGYGKLFELIDSTFLDVLSLAYRFRYVDNFSEPTSLGFFRNQFIGELDYAISLFERLLILSQNGQRIPSIYRRDLEIKNPVLIENNWVAQGMNKKAFMETDCIGFAIFLHPNNLYEEINVSSEKLMLPYDGTMSLIRLKFNQEVETASPIESS